MTISRGVLCLVMIALASPAAAQDACRVGAQSASAAAQDYRLAVGKVRASCTKSASDCNQRRDEADQLLEALVMANDVMQEACVPGTGGGTAPGVGELVITEVMVDPEAASDEHGEWIEVYNPTTRALDLQGLTLETQFTTVPGTPHVIASSVVVPAGGYVVLGRSSDTTLNGGVAVSYAYSGVELPNQYLTGNYELRISSGATIIDSIVITDRLAHIVSYENWLPGRSRSLMSGSFNAVANDDIFAWCMSATAYGTGDYGTPGYLNNQVCTF